MHNNIINTKQHVFLSNGSPVDSDLALTNTQLINILMYHDSLHCDVILTFCTGAIILAIIMLAVVGQTAKQPK